MLYIFHVDTGRMMTFDMNLALESVSLLKEMIQKTCNIPQNTQVLLVSGGEVLIDNNRVCSYSAGTDTNPIYMFSTSIIDDTIPPEPSVDYGQDRDLSEEVESCMSLPPTYSTVVTRVQLAQRFYELAREQERVCQKLVHDQHLQQQGWAAVVANMEDITEEFTERAANFNKNFAEHLEKRETYLKFLSHFRNDLDTLSRIPILPALAVNCKEPFTAFDEVLADKESFSSPEQDATHDAEQDISKDDENISEERQEVLQEDQQKTKEAVTLLHWIAAKENQKSLERIAIQCTKGLDLFDDEILNSMRVECKNAVDKAHQPGMREIKGLGDRLFGLEQLMQETKRCVQEQRELAQAFLANQNRASHLGDTSILPDLCMSHQRQLKVMLSNHQQLRDIRRRCTKAKEELGLNLYHRLKWIVYVENRMFEADNRLMFYHRSLNRLQRHLSIVEQIHQAPSMYMQAINEVVRRRTFSQAFLVWASDLACHLLTIHNEEVMRRQEFSTMFEGHFLNALFPGMEDLPPSFATRAPSIFDTGLPKITQADVQHLGTLHPDLVLESSLPDLTSVLNFFLARSGTAKSQDKSGTVEERLATVADAAGLSTNLICTPENITEQTVGFLTTYAQHQHLKDFERGFESETDTEEFEKVGQSPIDCQISQKHASTSIDHSRLTAENSTLTEENLSTTAVEVSNIKQLLQNLSCLSSDSLTQLRYQLSLMKSEIEDERKTFQVQYDTLLNTWQDYKTSVDLSEREKIQRLTVDHELEQNDIKNIVINKDEEIMSLKNERAALDVQMMQSVLDHTREKDSLVKTISDLKTEIEKLNHMLSEAENIKQQALKEMQEKLIHDYKTEMESLRCRFRLMTFTNMERSPSDTSLEKIERTDMIEIANHEAILLQTKEDMLLEKEKAIQEAIEKERLTWEAKFATQGSRNIPFESLNTENVDFDVVQLLKEKEKQIDEFREREVLLEKECLKYKETIQKLAESTVGSVFVSASEDIREVCNMEIFDKAKRPNVLDLNASVAVMSVEASTKDVATSPVVRSSKHKPLTSSQTSLVQSGRINIASCSIGDHVLIVWNSQHGCYTILQESSTMYFLHSDSINALNLKPASDGTPKKDYCTGEVEDKEYCHAKKDENRYKVPKGTRFYRVKVKPISSKCDQHLSRSCCYHSPHHSKKESRSYATSPSGSSESCSKQTAAAGVNVETQTALVQDSSKGNDLLTFDKQDTSESSQKAEVDSAEIQPSCSSDDSAAH